MPNNRNMSRNRFRDHTIVVQGNIYAPINAGSPEENSSWLEKISQENPAYHKKRIFESKGPFLYESFRWILDNPDFNKWRHAEKSGVFWIKGDPGKGKTMLLGGLIDDFEESPQIGINLAYFFCQATDSRINTAAAVIGGLIVSFIKQHHELRSYIRTKYKGDLDKLNGPDKWYILRDIFEQVTQHSTLPNPVCVVDALDECEQEHGRKQLLRLIIGTSCCAKWLISSRNVTEIERELQEIDSSRMLSLELKENAEYVTKSVDLYIDNSLQNIMALQGDEELQTKATSALKSKANGTFLWVALVIGQLRHTKHRDIEDVLEEMPEGLESLYSLILNRLSKQKDKDVYQILLSTVAAAERPLRLEELLTFISFQWKDYKTTYSLRDIQDIVKDCGSFLSIRDNTIYFIHQSVKEYMMGPAVRVIFPSGIEYQHYKMFTTSLSAMSRILKHNIYGLQDPASDINTISPPTPDPLEPIEYCCIFWVEHLFRSCESGASRDKIYLKDGQSLHKFLKDKYLCWLETLALLRCLVPQGVDAIQKLRMLLPSYCKSETIRSLGGKIKNLRGIREASRLGWFNRNAYQLIHSYKSLYRRTRLNYAYKFFNYNGDDSHLRAFIDDAYHFFYCHRDLVSKYPLQLYYSAITFEDTQSAIYTTFQRTIRTELKNAPASITMPQRSSFLMQKINVKCRGSIIALVYSPDSSFLCSLSSGGTISLFRTDIYTLEWVIELDPDERHDYRFLMDLNLHFLAFSRNSKHLVSISSTGVVQTWAVDSGVQMRKFSLNLSTSLVPRPRGPLYPKNTVLQEEVIALSRCGELAASTCRTLSGDLISVKIWTMKAGECSIVIDRSHMLDVLRAAFSPNSGMIALIDKNNVRVDSVQTGKEMKHISYPTNSKRDIRRQQIYCRFSPDSKLLALKYGCDTSLWYTETWKMVRRIKCEVGGGQYKFSFSPDVAMSVCEFSCGLLFESMDRGESLPRVQPRVWEHNCIFSPDWTQSSLSASYSLGAVLIWRVYKSTGAKSSNVQNTVKSVTHTAISPKSKYVAVWDNEGNIEIWSGESGECIQVLQREGGRWNSPFFSPDLEHVGCVQGREGDIQIWHIKTGKPLHLLKGPGAGCYTVQTDFANDTRYIVAGYQTGQVRVWCLESGTCLYEENGGDNRAYISQVAFSPGSKYIATVSVWPVTVCIWDWRKGHCISRTKLKRESSDLVSLTFSSDAKVLIIIIPTGFPRRLYKAKFYDSASGACLSHVDTSESNCFPLFDPVIGRSVSVRFKFCKMSSGEDWDAIPQPKKYCVRKWNNGQAWIHCGKHAVFQIPSRILGRTYATREYSCTWTSDSLLAFTNNVGRVVIIKLPTCRRCHIEQ